MTGNELYEKYCNEYPLIMGYREVSYESWLERQVLELRENIVNKNCNIPRVSNCYDRVDMEYAYNADKDWQPFDKFIEEYDAPI